MMNLGFLELIMLLTLVVNIVALWRILPRAGIPGWVALVTVVPIALPVLLMVLAFRPWPGDEVAKSF